MNMRNEKSTYDIRQHVITINYVERTSEHIPITLTLETAEAGPVPPHPARLTGLRNSQRRKYTETAYSMSTWYNTSMLRIYLAFKVLSKRGSQIEFVAGPLKNDDIVDGYDGPRIRLNPLNH